MHARYLEFKFAVIGSHITEEDILISEQNQSSCSDEDGTVQTASYVS